jgi:hypothetical protein
VARSAGAGTILLRNFALGAKTPWKRIVAVLEAATVLMLSAHYTMDDSLGATVAPAVDTWIASLF